MTQTPPLTHQHKFVEIDRDGETYLRCSRLASTSADWEPCNQTFLAVEPQIEIADPLWTEPLPFSWHWERDQKLGINGYEKT